MNDKIIILIGIMILSPHDFVTRHRGSRGPVAPWVGLLH